MTPYPLTLPYVGLRPTTPQRAAGPRIDAPVSPPLAPKNIPAPSPAAFPALEPPVGLLRFHGLFVPLPDDPDENSGRFVLPSRIAPAFLRRVTTVASNSGMKSASTGEAQVVLTPLV